MHHLRVGVHGGARIPVNLLPTAKPSAWRIDYHSPFYAPARTGESA
jgi:hypothetical protein